MSTLVEVKNFDDKKIDVLAETNRYATQLKPFVDLVRDGKIESLEALSNMPEFNDFVNNVTEAIAKNEKGYASILTDTDGTYKITGEGASSGKNIGLKNNGAGEMIPIIDTDMTTRTRNIIKEYLIAQTGIKETGMERFAPSGGRGGGGRPTKPPKYVPKVGGISLLEQNGKLTGVALGVKGIVLPQGQGVEERIDAVSYDYDPKLNKMVVKMKVTKVSGTESEGETVDADGNVTVSQGSKNTKENTRILNSQQNNSSMSLYAPEVPYPGKKGRFFEDLNELEQYLKSNYENQKSRYKSTTTKKVIKRSDLAAKASAAGYSVVEYEKLLKQKGVKIE
jgi:hypothetical protein